MIDVHRCQESHGSASAAGARPGLQNREAGSVSAKSDKRLRNQLPEMTARGQRPDRIPAELVEITDAWDKLPEAVKASMLMLVRASRKDSDK
jgi:hypothetical protein